VGEFPRENQLAEIGAGPIEWVYTASTRTERQAMTAPTEKQLDLALDGEFKNNPAFCRWFLDRTKFLQHDGRYCSSRSNHPWGPIPCSLSNPVTGRIDTTIKESETDVLVVFEASTGERFALHVENKIGMGRFTLLQAELYPQRAAHWAGNPKYGNYREFETVLVAPRVFYERNEVAVKQFFHRFVPHEDFAAFIPLFGGPNAE
jgi:hypothetical protein